MHEVEGREAAASYVDANRASRREGVQAQSHVVSDRDRAICAFVAEHPGAHPREIAASIKTPAHRIARRLVVLTAAGYLRRTGAAWSSSYTAGRPLPPVSPYAKRTCADCGGRWEPSREHAGTKCPTCRRLSDAMARAAELGVDGLAVVRRPLESRARAPHPLHPGESVWVDSPGDIEAIVGDRIYASPGAIAA